MSSSPNASSNENELPWSLSLGVRVVTASLLVLGFVACQPQGAQNGSQAVDTAAVKAELDSLRSAYQEAYNAGNFEKTADLPHPEMIYSPPGRPPIRGRDSIVAYEKKTRPPGATIDLQPLETRVLGSDWVYEMGIATITFTPEGAEKSQSAESTYLAIFRKTPDGWKTYRESISSNQPPN